MEITFLLLAVISVIVWAVVRFFICSKKDGVDFKHEGFLFLVFAYCLLVARGVYFPTKSPDGRMVRMIIDFENMFPPNINMTPLTFIAERYPGWWINVFGNIIIFIPAGIFIPMLSKRAKNILQTTVIGFGWSLLIELSQLFLFDRCSDIDDLILNTLGAFVGACIYFAVKACRKKRL
ncbi:MAG: VanZ family protein [Lachnospiraceae bacterium]|nr:VanZ family protein [Lachnospiraceae bacterium]